MAAWEAGSALRFSGGLSSSLPVVSLPEDELDVIKPDARPACFALPLFLFRVFSPSLHFSQTGNEED